MRFSVTALLGLAISIAAVVCGSVAAAEISPPLSPPQRRAKNAWVIKLPTSSAWMTARCRGPGGPGLGRRPALGVPEAEHHAGAGYRDRSGHRHCISGAGAERAYLIRLRGRRDKPGHAGACRGLANNSAVDSCPPRGVAPGPGRAPVRTGTLRPDDFLDFGRQRTSVSRGKPWIVTMRNVAPLWRIFAAAWFSGDAYQRWAASKLGNSMIAIQQAAGPGPSSSVLS
jgi:hypothetical protein